MEEVGHGRILPLVCVRLLPPPCVQRSLGHSTPFYCTIRALLCVLGDFYQQLVIYANPDRRGDAREGFHFTRVRPIGCATGLVRRVTLGIYVSTVISYGVRTRLLSYVIAGG